MFEGESEIECLVRPTYIYEAAERLYERVGHFHQVLGRSGGGSGGEEESLKRRRPEDEGGEDMSRGGGGGGGERGASVLAGNACSGPPYPKPGRAPKGKTWDSEKGVWIDKVTHASQTGGRGGAWAIPVMDEPPIANNSQGEPASKKAKKQYVPKYETGAWAMLVSLYEAELGGKEFMTKNELLEKAQPYSKSALVAGPIGKGGGGKGGGGFVPDYGAWSAMNKTLIEKNYVMKWSSPAKYKLTDLGRPAAKECYEKKEQAKQDQSFNDQGSWATTPRSDAPMPSMSQRSGSPGPSGGDPNVSVDLNTCATLKEGLRVRLKDLVGRKDLNGTTGVLKDFDVPTERWKVTLDAGTTLDNQGVEVKAKNISPLPSPGAPRSQIHQTTRVQNTGESYEILLVVDSRERSHSAGSDNIWAEKLRAASIPHVVRTLAVGDFIWISRNQMTGEERVLDHIIERKEVSDLASSIISKRYEEQKFRMKQCGLSRLHYLLEGDPDSLQGHMEGRSLLKALRDTYAEGFNTIRTKNQHETIRTIKEWTYSLASIHSSENLNVWNRRPTYQAWDTKAKTDKQMSVGLVWERMLHSVNRIGREAVQAIAADFNTPASLFKAIQVRGAQETLNSVKGRHDLSNRQFGQASRERLAKVLTTGTPDGDK